MDKYVMVLCSIGIILAVVEIRWTSAFFITIFSYLMFLDAANNSKENKK